MRLKGAVFSGPAINAVISGWGAHALNVRSPITEQRLAPCSRLPPRSPESFSGANTLRCNCAAREPRQT
eukprot:8830719-Pyramimonas_sp.AAC.1